MYLLGVLLKLSNEQPRPYYVSPPPRGQISFNYEPLKCKLLEGSVAYATLLGFQVILSNLTVFTELCLKDCLYIIASTGQKIVILKGIVERTYILEVVEVQ